MRSGSCEALYWEQNKDWWFMNESGEFEVREDAPELARISFKAYQMDMPLNEEYDYCEPYLSNEELSIIRNNLEKLNNSNYTLDRDFERLIKEILEHCFFLYHLQMGDMYHSNVRCFVKMPREYVIRFRQGEFNGECSFKENIIEWRIKDGKITVSDEMSDIFAEKEEFYTKAYFDFSIDTEKENVYIDYYFGRRFARGLKYNYEIDLEEEDVFARAGIWEEDTIWVS